METINSASHTKEVAESRHTEKNEAPEVVKQMRLDSVDLLRGLVMVIMALDHVRYPYFTNVPFGPENLQRTYLALFLTRWITHYCAPLFFLLAGTGAYLSVAQGRSVQQVSRFFLTRGLWLVFLELTVIAYAWSFAPGWRFGGVIWALGWSMVLMALIVRLPLPVIAAFGIATLVFHQLLAGINPDAFGKLSWLWMILYSGGVIKVESLNLQFPILYTIIPWVGIMASGYALGQILTWEPARRRQWLLILGLVMTLAFVLLRATNLYGDPQPFAAQGIVEKSVIAFLNVSKYPASLQFILMTVGPALMLLAWFDRFDFRSGAGWLGRMILVYGRVPMFYYILHLFTIHLLAIGVGLLFQQPVKWLFGSPLPLGRPAPPEYGHGLLFIYFITIVVVVLLYFPCKWFAEFKQRRKDWWLRYI